MNLARIMRFFGLRSRHHAPGGRRSRLSIRMSRVFHRPSMMARRSTATTAASVASPPPVDRSSVTTTNATPESNANARNRRKTMIHIPENEPVTLDWGLSSGSNSMDLRKSTSRSSSLVRQEEVEGRLLVQRLILEELQNQGRKSVPHDSRSTMMERAQTLSMAFLEGRGSELIPARYSSARDEGEGGPGEPGPAQQLTHKEEKKLRKSVARVIRSEEKKLKKLEKLNRKRAKQYARADEFFEQVATSPMDVSDLRTSYSVSRQSESYHFDIEAAESKWHHHQRASDSLSLSLTQYGRQRSDTMSSSLSRSRTKPPRMEFLFFGGCADDVNLNELEVGHKRPFQPSAFDYSRQPSADFTKAESCTVSIKINPTLVRNMPRPFEPRMEVSRMEVYI